MFPSQLPPYIKEIMDSMGWNDGSFIPIANEDNKKLLDNVNKLVQDRLDLTNYLQTVDARLRKLIEHTKQTEYDVKQNLNLISAYRSQHASETNMLLVAERENSKLHSQIKEIQKEHDERNQYEKMTENNIEKITKNVEKFSNQIKWAKTCLMEWRQAISKGDETNKLIQKYCKEDDSKALALDNKRKILQDTINKQKSILIELHKDQKCLEQTLDRMAQLYRQITLERCQLINTWKDAVNQMNQREIDVIKIEKDLESALVLTNDKEQKLKEQDEFMHQQILNNKEIEIDINDLNREISNLKLNLKENTDSVKLKRNELDIGRRCLQSLEEKLQFQRQKNLLLIKEKSEKELDIEKFNEKYDELKKIYDKFRLSSLDAEERIQQLEDMISSEKKIEQEIMKDISKLNNLYSHTQNQIDSARDIEKLQMAENQEVEVDIQLSKKQISKAKKELPILTVNSYDLDYKIDIVNNRIDKIEASLPVVDETAEQEKLTKLKNDLEFQLNNFDQLENKITRNDEDMKILSKHYCNDMTEIENMNSKIKRIEASCNGYEKELKNVISENQENVVELSITKMRLREMEKEIEKHEDKLCTLEKHRKRIEHIIKHRLKNIQDNQRVLFLKKKHLNEEKNTLKADIGERSIKIDALKKRYDLGTELLGKNDDGSPITATQLKISFAQEKQMLLQDGNELNEKVLKAENDIKAMENTLVLFNYSNDSYKRTFEEAEENNPEILELKKLQGSHGKLLVQARNLKGCIVNKSQSLEEITEKRDRIERDLEEAHRVRMEKSEILGKIQKEIQDQCVKISRAERELKLSHKGARNRCLDPEYFKKFEKHLDLREMEEKNVSALQLLGGFVEVNIELAPLVSQLLFEKGMKIPQPISRSKSQQTLCRSDFSDFSVSENSLRIFSASSKASSIASSTSSKNVKTGGSVPSVVSIDFQSGDGKQQKQRKK